MKENASQKKRIEELIDTSIAFITVEDTKAYLEDEGDLAYNDDDIYDAIVKVCGEGFIAVPVEVKLCRDFGFNCGAIAVLSVEEFCECKFVIAF